MPERFNKAIVIGDACVDIHIAMKDLKNYCEAGEMPYQISPGGTCGGTAVMLARLGVETSFLGSIGSDFGGRYLKKQYKALSMDTSMMIEEESLNTINVFAFINETGERHLWAFPRSDQAYAQLDLYKVDPDKIRTAAWLHSSGMAMLKEGGARENIPELFKIAYEAGVPTSFDFNTRVSDLNSLDQGAVDAIRRTLPYVKILTGSAKDEFVSFSDCDDWKESIRSFANEERIVIARMGKDGFIVIHDGEERKFPSYNVEVKDSTGAGDCFNAGFIAGILDGKDLYEACAYANGVSAYKISHPEDVIEKDKIETFMKNTALRKAEE